jgi:DNA invertase Pin-like site-specific DNA recombinase
MPRQERTAVIGYVSDPDGEAERDRITTACGALGLPLVDVERRPQLDRVFERVRDGEASCLMVSDLTTLSTGVAELADVVDRLERNRVRLIALDVGLDTATESGRLATGWSEPEPELERELEDAFAPEPEPAPIAAPPEPAPPAAASAPAIVTALGYASVGTDANGRDELDEQARAIEEDAATRGLEILEVVREREPKTGSALDRPGLSYLIGRIAAGEAACLVVSRLDRLSRSVADLGTLVQWLERNKVRLVVVDLGFDTASPGGHTTARALASVARWEHERLSERTRSGLAAARAKRHAASGASGPDWIDIRQRIAQMRADGMTLQAIADVLNAEGVPTLRGGAEWRPSSVQTAAGYKRRSRPRKIEDLPDLERPPAS